MIGNDGVYSQTNKLAQIFSASKPIIATLHLAPLPGAPFYRGQALDDLCAYSLEEAATLIDAGVDGLIVENHGDIPFVKPERFGHETTAAMTAVGIEVQRLARARGVPVGVNALANAAMPALAVAKAISADFVRINQFVNAYIANEGLIEGLAGEIMRYRAHLLAEDIAIFTDVHVKHGSHSIVADRSIEEQARDALFFCSDVLICTGSRTGSAPDTNEIARIKVDPRVPVLIGSGASYENVGRLLEIADGAIVASYFKDGGVWQHKVVKDRVERFMDAVRAVRLQLAAG